MPIPFYFFYFFLTLFIFFLVFELFKSIKENKKDIKDVIILIVGIIIILFLLISNFRSCQQENNYLSYLNHLSDKNIDRISFYEYINESDSNNNVLKGKLISEIYLKKDLKVFICNFWQDIDKCFERALGRTYILELKIKSNKIVFKIEKSHLSNYVKLTPLTINAENIVPSITSFKSYKLYKYFDILEKREKELMEINNENNN